MTQDPFPFGLKGTLDLGSLFALIGFLPAASMKVLLVWEATQIGENPKPKSLNFGWGTQQSNLNLRHRHASVTSAQTFQFQYLALTSPHSLKGSISITMTASTFYGFIAIVSLLICNVQSSTFFTIRNHCPHTIWPGTLAGSGTPALPTTGFQLESGGSVKFVASPRWSGRIWARTGCVFDELGVGTCQTGDCGGRMECNGIGAAPPVTLFEITLGKGEDKDFYDVSVVDGYNLPIVVAAHGVHGRCNTTGCAANLNAGCPKELQVVDTAIASAREDHVVGCKSACEAFGTDEYCCSGEYANPNTCKPSYSSVIFKKACPKAYSYAFDDGTSTFTCKAINYTITFCPRISGSRSPNVSSTPPPPIRGQSNGENWGIVTPSVSSEQNGGVRSSSIPLHITLLVLFILFS